MSIASIGQNTPITAIQKNRDLSSESQFSSKPSADTETRSSKIDFRNISANEINELTKSGIIGLTSIPSSVVAATLPMPSDVISNNVKYDLEHAKNIKIDFLGQIESSILFKKSIGEDASTYEKELAMLMNQQGKEFPSKIDIVA